MNIKEKWGSDYFDDAKTADLINIKTSEFIGGELECMQSKIDFLTKLVAALIDKAGLTDQQKLDLLDLWNWEVKEAA